MPDIFDQVHQEAGDIFSQIHAASQGPVSTPAQPIFDPDAFMASRRAAPPAFDPDALMATRTSQNASPPASQSTPTHWLYAAGDQLKEFAKGVGEGASREVNLGTIAESKKVYLRTRLLAVGGEELRSCFEWGFLKAGLLEHD
jgi:hypothetical protein